MNALMVIYKLRCDKELKSLSVFKSVKAEIFFGSGLKSFNQGLCLGKRFFLAS
jgi:hypothetical protein